MIAKGSRQRRLKGVVKQALLQVHRLALRVGFVIAPKHYYVPFADINELRRTREKWAKPSQMRGVAVDLDAQLTALRTMVEPYRVEYVGNRIYEDAVTHHAGPGYGYIEAQALHGMVRHLQPRQIIEVGSGVSTYCMLEACRLNERSVDFTSVEPYPTAWLQTAPVRLLRAPVQEVDVRIFDDLRTGDLLSIDSSHTVKTGGDVPFIVAEVLPRLEPGVIVHIHDIFLPYDYQRNADRTFMQWLETAMVHAFLIGNRDVEIVFALSMLHYERRAALQEVFPEYRPQPDINGLVDDSYPSLAPSGEVIDHFPSSLYLRVKSG